jgi:pimeloyl-ACP methyl ester carboxylesterase
MLGRLLILMASIALLVMLAPQTPVHADEAAPTLDRTPALVWGACPPAPPDMVRDPRQECATVRVPLDYRKPNGRTIDVEVSRIATAKPGLRRGILLSNPGGPGVSGLDAPSLLAAFLPVHVRDRYDPIGFDPRGVGSSTPVTCGISPDTPPDLFIPYPAPDGSIASNVAFASTTAQGCAAHSGDLLPYLTTANTARDMDRIRRALGEPKLSYLGYSYGTYLGAVYASLFPQRTDRIILDSAVDPRRVWYDQFRTSSLGFALRLPDFTTWAAARDATYHLGATPSAVTGTYYAVAARLDQQPVTLPDGSVIAGNLFRLITSTLLEDDRNFPTLADFWQAMAGTGPPVSPAPRRPMFLPPADTAPQVPADNLRAAQYAVLCDDVAWPRDITTYARNVTIDRRLFPGTAGAPANLWPCAFWPYRPVEPPVGVTDLGPRNVLILQNLRDPNTPWITGYGLRQALGRRAAMVSVNQGGHGVYLLTNATCANDLATTFLTHGTLPAHDQLCPGQPPPDTAAGQPARLAPPGTLG